MTALPAPEHDPGEQWHPPLTLVIAQPTSSPESETANPQAVFWITINGVETPAEPIMLRRQQAVQECRNALSNVLQGEPSGSAVRHLGSYCRFWLARSEARANMVRALDRWDEAKHAFLEVTAGEGDYQTNPVEPVKHHFPSHDHPFREEFKRGAKCILMPLSTRMVQACAPSVHIATIAERQQAAKALKASV